MSQDFNLQSNLSVELRFLLNCCKTDQSDDDIKEILSYLNNARSGNALGVQNLDISTLIRLANQHGILPLVYRTIKELLENNDQTIIQDFLSELKPYYMGIVQKNMLMSAELIRIMKLLKEYNIEVLAFKGPALAQIAYGDITLRQFSDLDILVHKKDFRVLAKEMSNKGYEPLYPIETFIEDKVMFEMNNDCPFYDTKRSLAVEIHWDFFRKLALPTKKFFPWDDTQTVNINGYSVKTLSHETHLLYHSLHGSKHVWERLEWIIDLDRLIRTVPDLNWNKILKMAKGIGAQKMFLLGVALAAKYFHTPLPENIRILCKEANLEPFISYVESEFNSDDPAPEDSLVKLSKVIGSRDNLYYKTLTVLEFLFRPGINERRTVILPDSLFWFYWALRPVGMSYRFVFCRLLKLCASKEKT